MGYLLADGHLRPVACAIRELSDNQAVLAVAGWMGIPDRFALYVEPDGLKYDCEIAARNGGTVTVRLDNGVSEARPRMRGAA